VVVEPELGTEARAPEEQDDEEERLALEEDLRAARPGRPLLPYVVAGLVVLVLAAGGVTALMWPAGAGSPRSAPSEALADESAVEIPASPPDVTPRAAMPTEKAAVAERSPAPEGPPVKRLPEVERSPAGDGSPAEEGSPVPTADGLAKPSTVAIAPPPAVVAPGPQPATAPTQAMPKPVEPAVAPVVRMGRLTVKVIPFAHVRANGRELGEAFGGATYQLKAGTYDIELEHPRKQVRKSVTIRPDQTVLVELNALE
jgi:hypothetical protein